MDDNYKQQNKKHLKFDASSEINYEKLLAKNYINNEKNINSTNVNNHQQMFENLYEQNKNCELILDNDGETIRFEPDLTEFYDFDDLDHHLHDLPVNLPKPMVSSVNTILKNEMPTQYLEIQEKKQQKKLNNLDEVLSFEAISQNINSSFNTIIPIQDVNQINISSNQQNTNTNFYINTKQTTLTHATNLYSSYSTTQNNHLNDTLFFNNQPINMPAMNQVEKTLKIEANAFLTNEQDAYNIPNEIFALYLESVPDNPLKTSEQCHSVITNNLKHKITEKDDEEILPSVKTIKVNSKIQGNLQSSPVASPKQLSPQPPSKSKLSFINEETGDNLCNSVKVEPARRYNLKNGFERLQQLLPNLNDGKSGKISKAAMLQKAAEYIHSVQMSQVELKQEVDNYNLEIDLLSNEISNLQNNLPENGVSMLAANVNRTDSVRQKFDDFVKERSTQNWKFYIFSTILKPLFDNYIENVNITSNNDLERLLLEWQNRHCNLSQLRPIVSGALRQLSKSTSILTDPKKLPSEVLVKIQKNQ